MTHDWEYTGKRIVELKGAAFQNFQNKIWNLVCEEVNALNLPTRQRNVLLTAKLAEQGISYYKCGKTRWVSTDPAVFLPIQSKLRGEFA